MERIVSVVADRIFFLYLIYYTKWMLLITVRKQDK